MRNIKLFIKQNISYRKGKTHSLSKGIIKEYRILKYSLLEWNNKKLFIKANDKRFFVKAKNKRFFMKKNIIYQEE